MHARSFGRHQPWCRIATPCEGYERPALARVDKEATVRARIRNIAVWWRNHPPTCTLDALYPPRGQAITTVYGTSEVRSQVHKVNSFPYLVDDRR